MRTGAVITFGTDKLPTPPGYILNNKGFSFISLTQMVACLHCQLLSAEFKHLTARSAALPALIRLCSAQARDDG